MEWLNTLLFDADSIAHIVILYSFVIALGTLLGKCKVAGISLGVAFILFVGIIAGHFGLTGNLKIVNFIQDFGLILFVYSIGMQVGPSFFSYFKEGGLRMNRLAFELVVLNIAVAIVTYFMLFDRTDPDSFPMLVGVLSGAVTNTPGLGAAEEALSQIGYRGGDIAAGYACAYPLAVLGVIMVPLIVKLVCKIDFKKEDDQLTQAEQQAELHHKPHVQDIRLDAPILDGKTLLELRQILNRDFICSRVKHGDEVITPHKDTILHTGDILRIVSSEDDAEAVGMLLGSSCECDWEKEGAGSKEPMVSRRIVVTRSDINGKTLGQLQLGSAYDVTITRVVRSGTELLAQAGLVLQIGDRLIVVGHKSAVQALASRVGNEMKRLDTPNIATMFIGILLGIVLGSIPIRIPGIPTPMKLGLAGGPLVVAILIARFGYKIGLVTYSKASANNMVREIGISLFLASVGIKSGANFVETLMSGGITYLVAGLLITVIPVFVISLVARVRYKMNYFNIIGIIAGANTNPPALAYGNAQTDHDAPAVSYSTVYPLTMFLRILTAQLLVIIGSSLF
ncbi:MAG: putative transporter [Bacteroidaceae bacterium]|nr:putative transporter [Bacteroidaceae bacterium]